MRNISTRLSTSQNKMVTTMMKSKITLVLKALLFYTTMTGTMLYVAGIDDLFDKGVILLATLIVATLIYLCLYTIRRDELDIILLNKFFDRLMGSSRCK